MSPVLAKPTGKYLYGRSVRATVLFGYVTNKAGFQLQLHVFAKFLIRIDKCLTLKRCVQFITHCALFRVLCLLSSHCLCKFDVGSKSQDSPVGKAMGLRDGRPGFYSRQEQEILLQTLRIPYKDQPVKDVLRLRLLVADFPPRRPGFRPGSGHVRFCDGQKWRWGRFSPRTSVSPANLHSICFTIIFTVTRGWHNRPGVAAVPIASQTKLKKNVLKQQSLFIVRTVRNTYTVWAE
jgi:hypothetical protein